MDRDYFLFKKNICCANQTIYAVYTCAHIFLNAAINSVACHTSIFRETHQGKFMLCIGNVIVSHIIRCVYVCLCFVLCHHVSPLKLKKYCMFRHSDKEQRLPNIESVGGTTENCLPHRISREFFSSFFSDGIAMSMKENDNDKSRRIEEGKTQKKNLIKSLPAAVERSSFFLFRFSSLLLLL